MNSSKTSPATRTRKTFGALFGKSRVRPVAVFITLATLATAGFSATSSAGSINKILFGKHSDPASTAKAEPGKARAAAGAALASPAADSSSLLAARQGHTATTLDGGKVLIVGGDEAGTAELFDTASATSAVTGGLSIPRFDHSATKLADGRVIVIGGRSGGTSVASTEIYNTATGSFEAGPSMGVARAGHSATLLSDGRVLVAGGDAAGSAEIYDPAANSFGAAGALGAARSMHSAALMLDGRVLVVGGRDAGGNALSSGEIFDVAASGSSPVGNELKVARVRAHLRVLFDGKVQIIGGSDDGTMEVYDPSVDTVGAYAHVLPESDTCAGLPGQVLASQTRAALFHNGQTDALLDRTAHTIAELSGATQALVAGGVNTGGSVLNSFSVLSSSSAAISTDKLDYAPGEEATITGRGFEPGETVRVKIHEDPHTPQERGFDVTADADGSFSGKYLVQDYDLDMKFIVGARGLTSGRTAQTTFTDARTINSVTLNGGSSVSVSPGATITAVMNVTTDGTGANSRWRSSGWLISTTAPGAVTCVNHLNHDSPGTFSETFSITAPTAAGTYNAYFIAYNDDTCGGGASTTFTLSNGVTVNTGALAGFAVTNTSDGAIGTQTAGTPFNIKVRAVDAFGNTVTSFDSGNNKVMIAPSSGTLSAGGGTTAAFTNGVLASHSVTFSTSGSYPGSFTLTATRQSGGSESGTSNSFTVNGPPCTNPSVTTNPTNQAVTYGAASVSFNAAASGNPTPTVQWQVSSGGGPFTSLTNTAPYSGVTTGTLTISNPTVSLSGNQYRAVFTNTCGGTQTATSSAATLTVNPKTVTPTVTVNNKVYDGTTAATIATRSLSGVVGADDVTLGTSGTAAFADKNVGTGKTVNITGLALSGATAGNYQLSSTSATATANITAASVTGSFTASNKVYDGNNSATIATRSLSGVISPDVVTLSGGTATFSNKNVGTAKTVTGTGFSLSGADAANYSLASTTLNTTADITPATLTGSFTASSKTYDGNTSAGILTRSLTGVISPDVVTLSGGAATFDNKNVGTGKTVTGTGFTLAGADAGNYSLASTTLTTTADITALHITGSFTASDKVYDGNTSANVLTRSLSGAIGGDDVSLSGGTATFADKNVGVGKTVTLSGATLSGTDAGNYVLDSVSTATAKITPRPLTVSATGVNRVYDGSASATVTLSDDRVSGDAITASYTSASFADKNVGVGKSVSVNGISISGADAGNYSLSNTTATTTADITPRPLTVTAAGVNKEYDGTTVATVTLSDDRVSGDSLSASYTSASFADKNVGTAKPVSVSGISVSGADAGNYSLANTTASANADITAKAVTVSATGVNKVYDGTTAAAVTLSTSGVVGGDNATANYTSASFADKNVGTGKPVSVSGISLSGADAGNYTVNSTASANADITALPITGSFTAASKIYDGTAAASILTRSVGGQIGGDDVSLVGGTAAFADKNVGTGKTVSGTGFTLSGTDAGNYALASNSLSTTADITPRALTVSAAGVNKQYDGTTNATVTLSDDRVAGDDVEDHFTAAGFADKNVGSGKSISVSGISITGTDAGNYSLQNTTANTTADITAKPLNVSATGVNKVYDGTASATVTLSDDRVSGDVLNTSYSSATFDSKSVGTGKPISVTGISVSGADAGNYTFNTSAITSADVTALAITGSITAASKTYDGTTAATISTRTLSAVIGSDDVSYVGGTATFSDKNAGTGKTVTATGLSLSGADAANYSVNSSAQTTADINALALTGSFTADNKVYDGTTAASVLTRSLSGVLSGDDVSLDGGTANFADKNAGTGKVVTLSGADLVGVDAPNYVLASVATATANITQRPLTVGAAGVNKIYDGTTVATVNLSDDRVSGDDVSDSYASATFADKNVGTAKPVSVSGISISGTDAGNYTFNTTASTSADITPRPLTVTAAGVNKEYDGTNAATVNLSDDRVAGDVLSASYTSAAFTDKNVGTGKAINVSGISLSGADAGNYSLANTTASASADISAKALTISAAGVNKVYDGNANATVTLSISGVIGGDSVSAAYTSASFDNKNVGAGKPVSVSGISISGTDAGNYTANATANTTADVTALTITGSFTAASRTYDGTTAASILTRSVTGQVVGDDVSLTGGTAAFSDKNVGTGKTVTGSGFTLAGADAANYALASSTLMTTADITPRSLTVGATGVNKQYDGTTDATVTLSDDRVAGDDVEDHFTSASFADKNVGAGKAINVSGISISGADAGNYSLSNTTAAATADITARALNVTATGQNKVYDGGASATVTLSDDRVAGDALSLGYASASFDNKNVGTGKTVSVSGINVSGVDAGNYTFNTTAATTADITALTITGSITAASKTYDGTDAATITGRSLSGVIGTDDVSYVGGTATFSDKNAGTGKTVTATGLSLSGADAANYSVNSSAQTTADINALALTGSFTADNKVYDGNTSANVSGRSLSGAVAGDDVQYTGGTAAFDTKNVGTGKTVTLSGAGLSGADAANYTVNSTAVTTADISQRTLTVTATGVNKQYDGTTAATVNLSDDRVAGDDVSHSYASASFADKNVGANKPVSVAGISISGADAGNYTFNTTASANADITARALTVSAAGINKVYDGNASATVTLSDDRVSGDSFTTSYSSASFADKNVGTGKSVSVSGISISGADAGNYTFNATAATTADISAAELTGSFTAANKTYDGTTAASINGRSLSGVFGSDDVQLTGGTASFADKNVGTGKTVTGTGFSLSGGDAGNYTLAGVGSTSADITAKSLIVNAAGTNRTYDGTTVATVTLSIQVGDVVGGDDVSAGYVGASFADKNVGASKPVSVFGISLSGADAGNYSPNMTASTSADITARGLTVSAAGVNKVYDGSASATVTLSDDRVAGDDLTASYASASFDNKNVGIGKPVSVSGLSISGTDAGNYTFNTTAATTADITARALTVSASGVNKVYDGTAQATVSLSDDRVAGDSLTAGYASASFADKNVGAGKPVSVSGISIGGTDAGNYTFNTTASTSADITALTITGSVTAAGKTYDGTDAAAIATRTLSGVVPGDAVNYVGGSATFDDKNVGNGKPVTATGLSLSGADAGNYTVNSTANTTADITPKALTVSASGINKVYDGNTNATVNLSDDRVSGDSLTTGYSSASFADKNVGTGKAVSVSGISVTGADSGNYTFNAAAATTADITARALTVSAAGQNKTYDGTAVATVVLSDDRLSGDTLTTGYASASFDNKNVGAGKPVSVSGINVSGVDAGNYTFNVTAATTADITARSLNVSATGVNKTYDGTNAATATLSDNRVSGDALTTGYSSASFADKNVGTNKAVSVSGINVSGADAGNYNLANTAAATTANINARALAVSASGQNKVYDGTTAATVTLSDNRVSGDALTTGYASASFANKDAGNGKTVTVTGISVSGADAGNYTANTSTTTTADITKKGLTVTADSKSMIFGGTAPAFTVSYTDGFVPGENAGNLGGTSNFTVKNNLNVTVTVSAGTPVGTYTITPSGLTSNNYAINFANGTLSIGSWTLTGFYQPVDMSTGGLVLNTIKGGSTVPLKFNVFAGTPSAATERKSISDILSFQFQEFNCTSSAFDAPIEVTTTGGTTLRYDATAGQFIQNWQTPKTANKCYQVRMTTIDGAHLDAYFKTK